MFVCYKFFWFDSNSISFYLSFFHLHLTDCIYRQHYELRIHFIVFSRSNSKFGADERFH